MVKQEKGKGRKTLPAEVDHHDGRQEMRFQLGWARRGT
jgi:hypothetical protein